MSSANIVDTVRALFEDGTLLLRQEVKLAKAEAEEKIEQVQYGVIEIGAAALIAMVALFVLAQAVVQALANLMPPSLAALLVGVVLAICAYVSFSRGQQNLTARNLTKSRTAQSIREDIETIKEAR